MQEKEKKNQTWLFGADRKLGLSESLSETVTLGTEFYIRTSHSFKILIFLHTRQEFPRDWLVQGNAM